MPENDIPYRTKIRRTKASKYQLYVSLLSGLKKRKSAFSQNIAEILNRTQSFKTLADFCFELSEEPWTFCFVLAPKERKGSLHSTLLKYHR